MKNFITGEILVPKINVDESDTDKDILDKITISLPDDSLMIPENIVIVSRIKDKVSFKDVDSFLNSKASYLIENYSDVNNVNSKSYNGLVRDTKEEGFEVSDENLLVHINRKINELVPFFEGPKDIRNERNLELLIERVKNIKNEIIQSFKNKTRLTLDSKKMYINVLDDFSYNYSVTSMFGNISLGDSPIDVYRVIKEYKTSEQVPMLFISREYSDKPLIKYNKIIPKNQIKDWVESNVPGKRFVFKKPKGLSVKVLDKSVPEEPIYRSCNLSRYIPVIRIKAVFRQNEFVKFGDQIKRCFDIPGPFISGLRDLYPKIQKTSNKLLSLSVSYDTLKFVDLSCMYKILSNRKGIEIDYTPKKILKINNRSNIITFKSEKTSESLNVSISSITNEAQIQDLIGYTIQVLFEADKLDGRIKNPRNKPIDKIKRPKELKKIQQLKELGIGLDNSGCQKIRRPTILPKGTPKDSYKYSINVNGNDLYCPDSKFKYPGYTNTNSVCCFIKDQRKKEVFIKNNGGEIENLNVTDYEILKKGIIMTDKILGINRVGILCNQLNSIFKDDDYIRLGNDHTSNSFVNVLKLIPSLNIGIDKAHNKFTRKIYKSLTSDLEFDEIQDNLKNFKEFKCQQDTYSKILDIVIVVISNDKENIYIDIYPEPFFENQKSFICLYNNNGSYELITRVEDSLVRKLDIDSPLFKRIKAMYSKSRFVKTEGNKDPPENINELLSKNKVPFDIKIQFVNPFCKVDYIKCQYGIIPVAESKIIYNLPTKKLDDTFLLKYQEQFDLLNESGIKGLTPESIVMFEDKVTGIKLKNGMICFVKPTKKVITDLSISEKQVNGYQSINSMNNVLTKAGTTDPDEMELHNRRFRYINELYQRFRFFLSESMTKTERQHLNDTIKEKVSPIIKLDSIKKIVINLFGDKLIKNDKDNHTSVIPVIRTLCTGYKGPVNNIECEDIDPFCGINNGKCGLKVNENLYHGIIEKLSTELYNGSKEIMQGKVIKEFLDKNDFLQRESDAIILEDDDIIEFLKRV
jgi:hypothetical protein